MVFLNATALLGLLALIIPILLHFRKRRKPREIPWAAMRFLSSSLAARRRGLTLENLLLLFCRCLMVALFVLAMGRPVGDSSNIRMMLVFGGCIGGVYAIVYAVVNQSRFSRVIASILAVSLLSLSTWLISWGKNGLSDWTENDDLGIVLDGTMSMTIKNNEKTPFENAIIEGQKLINHLSGRSSVSIVLAGPVPTVLEGSPFRNLTRARQELEKLRPVGGGGNLQEAVSLAKSLIEKGTQSRKRIVVFSDNQLSSWQQASLGLNSNPNKTNLDPATEDQQPIRIYGHLARLPKEIDNLSVTDIRFDSVLLTSRTPLPIEVDVFNGGTVTVHRRSLKLQIDGNEVATQPIPQLEPGAHATLRFNQSFQTPGHHVITCLIPDLDSAMEDNRHDKVVSVVSQVPILVVDGNLLRDQTLHSATFAALALSPAKSANPGDRLGETQKPIVVDRTEADNLGKIADLQKYQIIIICDNQRLSDELRMSLTDYVKDGGTLWIVPGKDSEADFYNRWSKPDLNERFLPGKLVRLEQLSGQGPGTVLGFDMNSIAHPGLKDLVARSEHDLGDWSILSYWKIDPNPQATVFMRLSNGDPLFMEQPHGRGRIILQSLSLNRQDSNLITLVTFPVLFHLLVQRLASSDIVDLNFLPTPQLMVELQDVTGNLKRKRSDPKKWDASNIHLVSPDGNNRVVKQKFVDSRRFVDTGLTAARGLYRMQAEEWSVPFTVKGDPGESELIGASPEKLKEIGSLLGIDWMDPMEDLQALNQREIGNPELWKYLVYSTLCLMGLEAVVAAWVVHRRLPSGETILKSSQTPPKPEIPNSSYRKSIAGKSGGITTPAEPMSFTGEIPS